MTELDLTQPLPTITKGGDGVVPWHFVVMRGTVTDLSERRGAKLGDLLTCLAALPVETQAAVVAKLIAGLSGTRRDELHLELHELLVATQARSVKAESALATATAKIEALEAARQDAVAALREAQLAIAPEYVTAAAAGGVLASGVDEALKVLGDEPRPMPKPPEER